MIQLPLTTEERVILRSAKIKLAQLANLTGTQLAKCVDIPIDRCNYLVALSQFQSLGSVGHLMAEKIWRLGYTSLQHLARADPVRMYRDYSRLVRTTADPCVEDVFRCAIAQVKYKNLPDEYKQWWYWTPMRGQKEILLPATV